MVKAFWTTLKQRQRCRQCDAAMYKPTFLQREEVEK
jgi:hypothetical protein